MDGNRVSQHQIPEFRRFVFGAVEFAGLVEANRKNVFFDIDGLDQPDIAVVDVFVVVIADLHDLIANAHFDSSQANSRSRPHHRIQSGLQLLIEGGNTGRTSMSGLRTWMSRNGSNLNLAGMRLLTMSTTTAWARSASGTFMR